MIFVYLSLYFLGVVLMFAGLARIGFSQPDYGDNSDRRDDDDRFPPISCGVCHQQEAHPGSCDRPDCPYLLLPTDTEMDGKEWLQGLMAVKG